MQPVRVPSFKERIVSQIGQGPFTVTRLSQVKYARMLCKDFDCPMTAYLTNSGWRVSIKNTWETNRDTCRSF